jgi:hypothetical protein
MDNLRYALQVQSQPSSQLSQQLHSQSQLGQSLQQSSPQQLALAPEAAGDALPNANALANKTPTMASE